MKCFAVGDLAHDFEKEVNIFNHSLTNCESIFAFLVVCQSDALEEAFESITELNTAQPMFIKLFGLDELKNRVVTLLALVLITLAPTVVFVIILLKSIEDRLRLHVLIGISIAGGSLHKVT